MARSRGYGERELDERRRGGFPEEEKDRRKDYHPRESKNYDRRPR